MSDRKEERILKRQLRREIQQFAEDHAGIDGVDSEMITAYYMAEISDYLKEILFSLTTLSGAAKK